MKRNRNVPYLCIGENFKDNVPMGDCGHVKTLMEWLVHLSHKTEEELNQFFDDSYTNEDIRMYIWRSWGKRLSKDLGGWRPRAWTN